MSLYRFAVAFGTRLSEAAQLRRLSRAWLTTGAVPVAHIVAEPGDIDVPALRLQPQRDRGGGGKERRVC